MKVFKLAAGLAIGYVLGSRAGRDAYHQIVAGVRKAQGHPAVTQLRQKGKELLGITTEPAREVAPDYVLPASEEASYPKITADLIDDAAKATC